MMRQVPVLRPKRIRPPMRDHTPSFFQMHVYDQELHRLEGERAEIAKRVRLIEERVTVVQRELQKLERKLKKSVNNLRPDF
jgi:predicted transcriptional regulator